MVIYADVLLAINFAVDFLILKGASHFCGKRVKDHRLVLAAAVGASSSLIVFFNMPDRMTSFLYRLVAAAVISAVTVCPCRIKTLLKCCFAVLLQSFIISGIIMIWQITADPTGVLCYGGAVYFDIGIAALITCSVMGYAVAWLMSGILARRFSCEQFCDVTVMDNGHEATFTALIDTGNSLVEPFSGAAVIVCEFGALGKAVPEGIASFDFERPTQAGIRLIPYKTMDSSGLLPAFMPQKLLIKDKDGKASFTENCYVAVTTARLGDEYRAICNPKVLINNEKVGDAVYESKG